ncbi:sugar phosphate isomerase/epimerase family protein [Parabacteroides sp.]
MQKTALIITVIIFMTVSCNQQKSSPLDNWKAGSANDDVFIEMTQDDMEALIKNDLPYLEIDWQYSTERTYDEIENWATNVKQRADKAGITIWSVHLPFGGPFDISQTNDTLRQKAVELNMNDMILSAKIVSPKKFVIHPSAEPIADEERAARIEASKKSLRELASKAKELNIPLLVENLPRTCLGNTSTELLEIINGIDNTAICFDVNHLLIEPQVSFVQNTIGKIQTTHMSDYDRKNERHWLPGEGVINWTELLTALIESGYKGPFIYEASKGKEPNIVTIQSLGDRWKKLKQNYIQ